jgi:hemoglobin
MNARSVAAALLAGLLTATPLLALTPAPTVPPPPMPTTPPPASPAAKPPSLYQRLGGYDVLAAFFDEAGPRILQDAQLARFFVGHSTDSNQRMRMRLIELLCADTGGPCTYTGRTMKATHGGMGITESDWNAFLRLLGESLERIKVKAQEKGELLAVIARYKSDIVEKP